MVDDVGQGLETQVASRRQQFAAIGRLPGCPVLLPASAVVDRFQEGPIQRRFDSHPRVGETSGAKLDVLSEGEFDPLGSVCDDLFRGSSAVLQFDHCVLAAHDVGRSVQQSRGGHSAGQGPEFGNVLGVDHVLDPHLRDDRLSGFVDSLCDLDVAVSVDDSRHHELACGVDDHGAVAGVQVDADGHNLAVADQD